MPFTKSQINKIIPALKSNTLNPVIRAKFISFLNSTLSPNEAKQYTSKYFVSVYWPEFKKSSKFAEITAQIKKEHSPHGETRDEIASRLLYWPEYYREVLYPTATALFLLNGDKESYDNQLKTIEKGLEYQVNLLKKFKEPIYRELSFLEKLKKLAVSTAEGAQSLLYETAKAGKKGIKAAGQVFQGIGGAASWLPLAIVAGIAFYVVSKTGAKRNA